MIIMQAISNNGKHFCLKYYFKLERFQSIKYI